MIPRTATLDTNILPINDLRSLAEAAGVTLAISTVTDRELGEADLRAVGLDRVPEAMVLGESRLGEAVLVDDNRGQRLEQIIGIISNGSFPKLGKRSALSLGQRNQLRDAMAFDAHLASGREAFVTIDGKAFIKDERRSRLEEAFNTRILSRGEFYNLLAPAGKRPAT